MNIGTNYAASLGLGKQQVGKNQGVAKTHDELVDDFYSNISSAATISSGEAVGDPIGLTMMRFGNTNQHYGMVASYSAESTSENPVIRVSSNYGGKNVAYDVRINEIDPRNASQLEMFALSSYMDDQGITDGGSFGTYSKMKYFGLNASENGYNINIDDVMEKTDWIGMLKEMMSLYFDNSQTYAQGLDCKKILDALDLFGERISCN